MLVVLTKFRKTKNVLHDFELLNFISSRNLACFHWRFRDM